MSDGTVHGICDARFDAVRDIFASHFAAGEDVGAAVAVTVDGVSVVDFWGGHADAERARTWQRDTLVLVFSVSKGIMATCVHMLVDRGAFDLDDPVAKVWPEFGQAGKQDITIRLLMSDQAGLAAITKPLPAGAQYEWETMTRALAEQAPNWEPGSAFGYHIMTKGWLLGELIRRATGKTPGAFLREELAEPLGADLLLGLPASEDARTADIVLERDVLDNPEGLFARIGSEPETLLSRASVNPPSPPEPDGKLPWNGRAFRAAEIPAANVHATARGIARVYAALACGGTLDGVHLLSPEAIDRAREEMAQGLDVVTQTPGRVALGYMLPNPTWPFSPNPRAFCHPGAGGAIGFADPEARLSFAYTMNRLGSGGIELDARARRLIDAVYAAL